MEKEELLDLAVSVLVLSFAFSKFFAGNFLLSLIGVFSVFVVHEIAHRNVARYFGAHAEYRRWDFGLLLALVTGLLPGSFVFAAPGAVYISPVVRKNFAFPVYLTKRETGIISVSGPLSNIIMGFVFLGLSMIHPLFFLFSSLSFFLALFNLVPIRPLDGSSVYRWSPVIWGTVFFLAFLGYLFPGIFL
ncbi:MAG: site-2 protease family protein [Candidatus Micrarchaeota archaeon]|nr:site-2 protease family protein [Candidatus Micrarchaeota archaeon]